MQFINQNSFLIIALGVIAAFSILLLRGGVESTRLVAIAALILGFVIAMLMLSPAPSNASALADVTAKIGAGKPVLVEYQSPF